LLQSLPLRSVFFRTHSVLVETATGASTPIPVLSPPLAVVTRRLRAAIRNGANGYTASQNLSTDYDRCRPAHPISQWFRAPFLSHLVWRLL